MSLTALPPYSPRLRGSYLDWRSEAWRLEQDALARSRFAADLQAKDEAIARAAKELAAERQALSEERRRNQELQFQRDRASAREAAYLPIYPASLPYSYGKLGASVMPLYSPLMTSLDYYDLRKDALERQCEYQFQRDRASAREAAYLPTYPASLPYSYGNLGAPMYSPLMTSLDYYDNDLRKEARLRDSDLTHKLEALERQCEYQDRASAREAAYLLTYPASLPYSYSNLGT